MSPCLWYGTLFVKLLKKVLTKQKNMKKTAERTFTGSLVKALLRGLAVFAIFGAAVYVYAAISYPANQPNPVSGVVGLYVGKTAGSYKGGDASGYQNLNNYCSSGGGALTNSHACTPMEIINTYNHNASAVTGQTGTVWVNSGAPGNTIPAVNDCNGWQDSTLSYYGNVWSFTKKFSGILPCAFALSIACCK